MPDCDCKFDYFPIDGIAVTIATYILSPAKDKMRNTIIVGGLHGALHNYACSLRCDASKAMKDNGVGPVEKTMTINASNPRI
jgi:hypothetical protein